MESPLSRRHGKLKALLLAIGFIGTFVILLVLLSGAKSLLPVSFERYAHGMLGLVAVFATGAIFHRARQASRKEIGLIIERASIGRFGAGLFAGLLLAAIMIFSQVWANDLQISLNKEASFSSFLLAAMALLPLALMEELAFRGYAFKRLEVAYGLRITQLLIAMLFALYHVLNGWAVTTAFLGPAVWSLAFGLCAAISGGVAMPTGLHFGVNMVLALIGGQKGISSIWKIEMPVGSTSQMADTNERSGVLIQLALLLVCILATE